MLQQTSREQDSTEPGNFTRIAPDKSEISLLDILIAIVRARKLIFCFVLCATLIGAIISLLMPIRYTATTSLLPPQQSSSAGAALLSQLGSLGSMTSLAGGAALGLKNPNDLQVSLLKSRVVEDAMIKRFHLITEYKLKRISEARKKLESVIDIENGAKDGLIRISVTDFDPARAAEMANSYVEEYRKRTAGLAVTEASQRRLFFEGQLSQAKDSLASAEEQLKATEQKTGLIQLDSQARAAIELIAQLRAQISAKEVQIRAMHSFATEDNPEILVAEQQLAGLKGQLAKLGADTNDETSGLSVPNGKIQGQGLEYVRKLREVKYYETIFELLARQYEIAKVDEARQGATIQVVDPAVTPDHRSSPKRVLITVGFGAVGLFLVVVWISVRETLSQIAKDSAEGQRLRTLRSALIAQ